MVPAGVASVGRVKLANHFALDTIAVVSTANNAEANPAALVATVMDCLLLAEKVPAYPALLVALLR